MVDGWIGKVIIKRVQMRSMMTVHEHDVDKPEPECVKPRKVKEIQYPQMNEDASWRCPPGLCRAETEMNEMTRGNSGEVESSTGAKLHAAE